MGVEKALFFNAKQPVALAVCCRCAGFDFAFRRLPGRLRHSAPEMIRYKLLQIDFERQSAFFGLGKQYMFKFRGGIESQRHIYIQLADHIFAVLSCAQPSQPSVRDAFTATHQTYTYRKLKAWPICFFLTLTKTRACATNWRPTWPAAEIRFRN